MKKNLIIGGGLAALALVLAYRAEKKGKHVPVIGKLFREESETELSPEEQAVIEAELQEEGEAVGFSNASSKNCYTSNLGEYCCFLPNGDVKCVSRNQARRIASASVASNTGTDCYISNLGKKCCYLPSGDVKCGSVDSAAARVPKRALRRASVASRAPRVRGLRGLR